MKMNKDMKILIVGLGLLGGSYAMALTKAGYQVTAITRTQKTIDYALAHGMIARGSAEVDAELVGEADLIVFALYPTIFIEWLEAHQNLIKPGAIL